jgi:hypothetical protein
VVIASLIGVKGVAISLGDAFQTPFPPEFPIDRDLLVLPDVIVEGRDQDIATLLRPAFDAMWQASGWERSHGYDAQGKWIASVHS